MTIAQRSVPELCLGRFLTQMRYPRGTEEMRRTKRLRALSWLTCLTLALSLCSGILLIDKTHAARRDRDEQREDRRGRRQQRKLSQAIRERSNKGSGNQTVKVLIQLNDRMSFQLAALLRGNGVRIKRHFINFNTLSVDIPAGVIESLEQFPEVEYVSIDNPIRSFGGHVAKTTGADSVRSMATTGILDGKGIGIAIVDSGIYQSHVSFREVGTTR